MRMLCPSSLVAALLCSVALLQARPPADPLQEPAEETCPEDQAPIDARLPGLWQRYETLHEGDPVRFYFFHPDGFGIYRYGKVGLTNTHSFDYGGEGGVLDLRFRKTDRAHAVAYRFESDGEREWLVLAGDPREQGAEVRYFRARDDRAACLHGALTLAVPKDRGAEVATGALGGRLWGEEQRYATGGMGFSIYQLQPQTIDGRGVGWHHRGDYDEWTTEALNYRQQGDRLALGFPLRHESQATTIEVWKAGDGVRQLRLDTDPRDFWRPHTYRDMGPSFAGCETLD